VILITGASSGIGEACARSFAASGQALLLLARRKERLDRLAKELSSKCEVHVFELDVRDRAAIEKLVKDQSKLFSRVSVLVNNAGLARGLSTFQAGDPADWDTMIDTNIKGLLYMTRAVLPYMIQAREGHVVNLGSVAGFWTYPKGNIYNATKFAVRALTEGLRLDLNGTGIRVTEISPGMVETEFSEVRLGDAAKAKAVYAGMEPLVAQDIAEAVLWAVQRPSRVNVQEIILYPTDQASPTVVNRKI
jgi:serine 3-dehydrogenase